jgi:hypothetical protein
MIVFIGTLVLLAFGLLIAGVAILQGLGWALIASGLAAAILAAIISRGVGRGRT